MGSPDPPTVAAAAVVVVVAAAEVAAVVAVVRFLEVAAPVPVAALAEALPVLAVGPQWEELRLAVAARTRALASLRPTRSARPNLRGPCKRTAIRAPESALAVA